MRNHPHPEYDSQVSSYYSFMKLSLIILLLYPLNPAKAQDKKLGKVDFPTSCNEEAHSTFTSGLALYHHMMYEQAESTFVRATQQDAGCAVAYWGIAMTYFHPLWPGLPTEAALKKGEAALKKAQKLPKKSNRESAFIEAANAFFDGWEEKSHPERIQNWESAQKKVFEQYPADVEAGTLYGLAHLATAPKSDKSFSHQKEAGAIMETLLEQSPQHPGLFHYTIHAYDNPVLANRAVNVARGYDKLAPDVPHALHMPTHIFVRLGLWDGVIQWNIRSAKAAWNQPVGNQTSMHYVHALDYLMYAYLQQGKVHLAEEVLTRINRVDNFHPTSATAYGIAAAQARLPLERRQWNDAAALALRSHSTFPWDKFPEFEAMTYFARAYGAVRLGDVASARSSKAQLDLFYDQATKAGQTYWAVHVDAQRKTIEAWVAYAEGNVQKALQMMQLAADIEDSVDKHPVTPGAILPAREILGDMLLLLDQPERALAAYETSLSISPN